MEGDTQRELEELLKSCDQDLRCEVAVMRQLSGCRSAQLDRIDDLLDYRLMITDEMREPSRKV
jgi:hypothetical protein